MCTCSTTGPRIDAAEDGAARFEEATWRTLRARDKVVGGLRLQLVLAMGRSADGGGGSTGGGGLHRGWVVVGRRSVLRKEDVAV